MSLALAQIRDKYGPQAADEVERLVRQAVDEQLMPRLAQLQAMISATLSRFTTGEMLPATQLQQESFKTLQAKLKKRAKLLLLYKSTPSAVLFDVEALKEVEEEVAATIAAFQWEAEEGRDVSPDEFWKAMDEVKPGHRPDASLRVRPKSP